LQDDQDRAFVLGVEQVVEFGQPGGLFGKQLVGLLFDHAGSIGRFVGGEVEGFAERGD
jgi:hypothetical protein